MMMLEEKIPAAASTRLTYAGRVLLPPLLVLVLGFGIVFVLYQDALDTARKEQQAELNLIALEIADRINDRMVAYDHLLHGLRGLFAEPKRVTREQFQNYVAALNLRERYPGLRGLAYIPLVKNTDGAAHFEGVQSTGRPENTARSGKPPRLSGPVTYLEPQNRDNARALGYDIYAEPTRRAAMDQARDTGQSSVSGKLSLVQDAGRESPAGFLMLLALYRAGEIPGTVDARRTRLVGWVDAVFDTENLMKGILGKYAGQLDVEIFDDSVTQSALLYDDDKVYRAGGESASLFSTKHVIKVGGRNWTLHISSLPAFEQQTDWFRTRSIATGGTIVSLLLTLLTWILVNSRARSKQVAQALAQELDARIKAEESLRLAGMVYENSSEGILVTDSENRIIAINPAFTRITGYEFDEVKGKNPRLFKSGRHDQAFYRDMWAKLDQTGAWYGEIWDRRKNGEIHAKYLSINTIHNEDGSVYRRVAFFMDISEQKKSEAHIWHQANFDSLTQLPNRRMFHDRLEQDIKKSELAGLPLGLLFIDLDMFKDINDTLGHNAGDELLVEAARRITTCVREVDTVARLGGDEFTVILPELQDVRHVEQVAEAILSRLDAPYQLGAEVVHITGSIGITLFPRDTADPEMLIRNADQAMYVAKNTGRKRYSYFTPELQKAAQERRRIVNDLHTAITKNDFKVHYQPVLDLATGRIVKAEALIRWQNKDGLWVRPNEFIPLAEEAGLIAKIGDLVFQQVVRDIQHLRQVYDPAFQISVNVSPGQLRDKNFSPMTWFELLRDLRLPGEAIVLEITEGLLLHASAEVTDRLQAYRNAGMEIAIDDFGTGYSSLAYLKRFDIDYLKIDQSFVRDIETDENDKALSQAIIVMAHALGLKVVAEGVETASQLLYLKEMQCDLAQGFLFSEPRPLEQFEVLLQAQQGVAEGRTVA